jgi:hypothetical protein
MLASHAACCVLSRRDLLSLAKEGANSAPSIDNSGLPESVPAAPWQAEGNRTAVVVSGGAYLREGSPMCDMKSEFARFWALRRWAICDARNPQRGGSI